VISTLGAYLASGGVVAIPLVGIGLLLWYLIGLRALALRPGIPRGTLSEHLRAMADGGSAPGGRGVLADGLRIAEVGCSGRRQAKAARHALVDLVQRVAQGKRAVRVLVAVAPLLGLLGTVTGMIETFASLADMTLFSRTGGIAGGISEALVSTQLGLVVAIPGLLAGRVLDQREAELRHGLDQIAEAVQIQACEEAA